MELFKPDLGLFVWMLFSFICLFFLLKKYVWTGILESIDNRNKHIASSLEAANEAQLKLQNIQEESNLILSKAREDQIAILHEGKKLKEEMLNDAKKIAQSEASKIVEDAHRAMARQRDEVQRELEQTTANLSVQIAEKILRRELENRDEQVQLAQRLLDDVQFSK